MRNLAGGRCLVLFFPPSLPFVVRRGIVEVREANYEEQHWQEAGGDDERVTMMFAGPSSKAQQDDRANTGRGRRAWAWASKGQSRRYNAAWQCSGCSC